MSKPRGTVFESITRRKFLQLCAASLAPGAVGCGRGKDRAYARGSTLIIAYPGRDNGMNPVDDEDAKFLMFLRLLDGSLPLFVGNEKGCLAERWEQSADYREWTFHLRPGVRWHDGVPVTAHDVKFTVELLAHPDVGEFGPHDVEAITVINDSTVRVRFARIYAQANLATWEVILPKHLLEHLDPKKITEWDFWTHPIGNGPYRFVRYVPRTMMEFDANPDYYRGQPRMKRVVLKLIRDNALAEMLSGNVDVVLGASPAQAALDASFRAYYQFWTHIYAIFWQNAHPIFKDPRVRQALTLAISRPELARVLNLPRDIPIVDGPYTGRQLRLGELPEPLPYDPAQARALLDAAGWRQASGARVREREGQPFRFTLLAGTQAGYPQIAVYVQEALRRVGVSIDIQTLDEGVVGRRIRDSQFEAALTITPWGPNYWQRVFGEKSPLGYRNAEVDRLLERLPLAMDPREEGRVRGEITGIFRVDPPATFLFPKVTTVLAHRRVRGLSSPWHVHPLRDIDELWLDDRGAP